MWGLSIGFAAYGYCFYLFLTWLPGYLVQAMHVSILKSATFTAIPWMCATVADLAVGGWLMDRGMTGKRVLLLYPSGLDFIAAFMGCLYGGAIAVPAYPPRKNRSVERIEAIAADATLFIRRDEVETAWAIVDSIRSAWTDKPLTNREFYLAGTWGPTASDDLLDADGREWKHPTV